jgi:hypothetical protein
MVLLADKAAQTESQSSHGRAPDAASTPRKSSGSTRASRHAAPPHLPGFITGVDRAIE